MSLSVSPILPANRLSDQSISGEPRGKIWVVGGLRRIGRDLSRRQHLDAYVVAAFALVLAVLSMLGDLVSVDLRWAAALAALGLLVFRITLPEASGDVETVLQSRVAFDDVDPDAPALTASDHFGLVATVAVSGCCSPASRDPRRPGARPRAPG